MINQTSNPYAQQILAKGRDLPTADTSQRTEEKFLKLPKYMQERYANWDEYQAALADFLNGY